MNKKQDFMFVISLNLQTTNNFHQGFKLDLKLFHRLIAMGFGMLHQAQAQPVFSKQNRARSFCSFKNGPNWIVSSFFGLLPFSKRWLDRVGSGTCLCASFCVIINPLEVPPPFIRFLGNISFIIPVAIGPKLLVKRPVRTNFVLNVTWHSPKYYIFDIYNYNQHIIYCYL